MSQQVGITLGTPIMSAIATAAAASALADDVLHGITTALAVNTIICVAAAALVGIALPGRRKAAA
jgi:hypothetical protein